MDKQVKTKKVVRLTEVDRKVLLEYSGRTLEAEMKVAAEATIKQSIHKLS